MASCSCCTAAADVRGPCKKLQRHDFCITSGREKPDMLQKPSFTKMTELSSPWAFPTTNERSARRKKTFRACNYRIGLNFKLLTFICVLSVTRSKKFVLLLIKISLDLQYGLWSAEAYIINPFPNNKQMVIKLHMVQNYVTLKLNTII